MAAPCFSGRKEQAAAFAHFQGSLESHWSMGVEQTPFVFALFGDENGIGSVTNVTASVLFGGLRASSVLQLDVGASSDGLKDRLLYHLQQNAGHSLVVLKGMQAFSDANVQRLDMFLELFNERPYFQHNGQVVDGTHVTYLLLFEADTFSPRGWQKELLASWSSTSDDDTSPPAFTPQALVGRISDAVVMTAPVEWDDTVAMNPICMGEVDNGFPFSSPLVVAIMAAMAATLFLFVFGRRSGTATPPTTTSSSSKSRKTEKRGRQQGRSVEGGPSSRVRPSKSPAKGKSKSSTVPNNNKQVRSRSPASRSRKKQQTKQNTPTQERRKSARNKQRASR